MTRDEYRRCTCNTLATAAQNGQQKQADRKRSQTTGQGNDGRERFCNGAALRGSTSAQGRDHTADRKNLGQSRQTGSAGQIDHRPAKWLGCVDAVLDRKHKLAVFGCHAQKGGNQHPEHRTRAAERERGRNPR